MFLMTGSGWSVAPLNVAASLPMVSVELGCVQSEPWKVWALSWNVIAVALDASEASVSIWLLPLVPCQFEREQLATAHNEMLLPEKRIVTETSMIQVPV